MTPAKTLFLTFWLLALDSVVRAWGWGANEAGQAPARFSVVPAETRREGQGQLAVLQAEGGKETFLDRLLGTNCYGRAVDELRSDCRTLDQDQKSRLALRLVNCQLATHGEPTFPCGDKQPLRQCTEALPDRAYQLYVEFLGHADSMCLFIQNQNFERYTEGMLNKLAEGSSFAKEQLLLLGEQTAQQHAHIAQQAQHIASAAEEALQLGRQHRATQEELLTTAKKHREESSAHYKALSAQAQEVLALQDEVVSKQEALQLGQASMGRALAEGSSRVESLFSFIDDRAQRQLALQAEHEAHQRQMTSELRGLAADTWGLRSAVDVIIRYEQRSDAALIKLLGRSYTLEDAAFYGAGLLAVLGAGALPGGAGARAPLLGLLGASLAGERLLLARLHMFLERDPGEELVVYLPTNLLPLPPALGPGSSEPVPVNVKWALRKALAGLGALLVIYVVAGHRNYERDSYSMLRRIEAAARASNVEQLDRLARIEQRIAALQAWDRQQQEEQEQQQKEQRQLALPAPGSGTRPQAAAVKAGRAAAARLLPPGLLLESAVEAGPLGGPAMGVEVVGRHGYEGSGEEGEADRMQRRQQQHGKKSATEPILLNVLQGGERGEKAGLASEHQPKTPAPHRPAAAAAEHSSGDVGPKRRGTEEVQGAVAEQEEGGVWGRARRRTSTGEEGQVPARKCKRGGATVGPEGTSTKRTRR